jgi:hypothetical protein
MAQFNKNPVIFRTSPLECLRFKGKS